MSKEETIRRIWADQPPYTTPMKLMSEAYDAALSQSAAKLPNWSLASEPYGKRSD